MENKGKVIILSLINIIRSLVLVSQAAIIKELINQACKGQDIFTYALILSLMVFLIIILRILYVLIKNKGELEIEVGMKKKITSALLTKDIARVKEYHSGEITNIALSDITNIKVGECEVIPSFFLLVSRFIFAGVLLVIYDYRLVLILLGFGVLGFLFARLYSRHMKRLQKQSLESDGRMNTFMQETVENISLIKALGSSDSINLGLAKEAESNYLIKSKRNRLQIFGNTSLLSMMNVAVAFTTIYGAFLITQGMEYGTFVALLQLVSYFEYPLTAMSGLLTSFNAYKASKERIAEILSLPEDDTQIEINDFDKIEISHLSFGYDRKIFDDFSTEIQKGETILIKGRSGVGKSTLFSLLLDFRKPKNGEINVCLNQEKHPISACRSLFSYVSQENILFSKSIRENIQLLAGEKSLEEINKALKTACIYDEIMEKEKKLDTPLSERGGGLSIGQIQRILLAIALLKKKPILLLDEFTSSLDKELEKQIVLNVSALDCTKLIITHHDITLENAKIMNLGE